MAKKYDKIWTRTNEHLPSIIQGLDVQSTDYIIAVCGSGDQGLAILERAKRVLLVDNRPEQIEFMKTISACIKKGDYNRFLGARKGSSESYSSDGYWSSLNYFTPRRFNLLKTKMNNLEIRLGNIIKMARSEKGFNKLYLSNALNHKPLDSDIPMALKTVSDNTPKNGLVYLADSVIAHAPLWGLVKDEILTSKITDPYWSAVVLRKED